MEADDVHGHQADGRGDAVAVLGQLVEGLVARLVQVLGHAGDQLLGIAPRNLVADAGVGPSHGHRVIAGRLHVQHLAAPPLQHLARVAFVLWCVHQIVAHPAEGVQRTRAAALGARQQARRHHEGAAVALGNLLTHPVGGAEVVVVEDAMQRCSNLRF